MRTRTDPVAVAVVAGTFVLVVLTGLMVSRHGGARDWTVPAAAGIVAQAPDPGPSDVGDPVVSTEGVQLTNATEVVLPSASDAWVADVASTTGIPPVALAAYADATLALEHEQRSCRLGWTTLAAIGDIESGHGRHGGAVLGADGRPSVPIIGPALDGYGVAAIPATPESTAWHGDPVWDHAVGPMQFLPSSWERWAADGDGDGSADPHDLDDAALAAGRYLCADGVDLSTADGWRGAVLSYNHSEDYLAAVLAAADAYAAAAGA